MVLSVFLTSIALLGCSHQKFEEGRKGSNAVSARLETFDVKISFVRNGETLDTFDTRRSDSDVYLRAFYLWSPDAGRVVCVVCSDYGRVQAAFDYKTGAQFQLSSDTEKAASRELNTLARLECVNTDSLSFCLCNATRKRWDLEPNITLTALAEAEEPRRR